MATETRHLTALHGDVVGYSKLTADNEIETHNTIQAFRRIIEEELDSVDGPYCRYALAGRGRPGVSEPVERPWVDAATGC